MMNPPMANDRTLRESAVIERFLESPNEESFADLFRVFTPQLVAFFRSRGCPLTLGEDLTQEVMLTVYRKAAYFFAPGLGRQRRHQQIDLIRTDKE